MNEPERKTILLLEADNPGPDGEARKLGSIGYHVVSERPGERAVRIATQNDAVDLVLLDIGPGSPIDGPETVRAILARKTLPVVFLADHSDPGCLDRVPGIPRYGFVTKGMDRSLLQAAVETALDLFAAQREAERLARRGEAILQVQPDLMFVVDRDGYYRDFFHAPDPGGLALPGERIIGSHLRDVFSPEEADRHLALYRACLETGAVQAGAYELAIQGELRTFDLRIARLDDRHILAIIRDITESRRAADMLRESEERLRLVLKASNDGWWDWDLENDTIFYSPRWMEMLGYEADEHPPDALLWRKFIHPDDGELVQQVIGDALESGRDSFELEIRLPHRNGHYFPVLARGFIYRDPAGKPVRISGANTDITQLKEAGNRIRSLLEEKEILLKEVHHRVKNNMNTMRSLLSVQAGRAEDPCAANILREAGRRLQSMEVLYDRLYRSENLRQLSLKDYLASLIHEAVSLFPNSALVEIRTRIEDFSLDVKVLSTLGIIVNELLTNVMKHAFPPGARGIVTVTAERQGRSVRLVMEDDGCGIPETVDCDHSGGFGLQLVGLLAKQIKGSIRIERTDGTRFVLDFEG